MGRAYQNRKESMAKTSDANARVYSRYGREIYVCAKSGGLDPTGNLALRALINRAKKDQVPTHVIEKAIKKAEDLSNRLKQEQKKLTDDNEAIAKELEKMSKALKDMKTTTG